MKEQIDVLDLRWVALPALSLVDLRSELAQLLRDPQGIDDDLVQLQTASGSPLRLSDTLGFSVCLMRDLPLRFKLKKLQQAAACVAAIEALKRAQTAAAEADHVQIQHAFAKAVGRASSAEPQKRSQRTTLFVSERNLQSETPQSGFSYVGGDSRQHRLRFIHRLPSTPSPSASSLSSISPVTLMGQEWLPPSDDTADSFKVGMTMQLKKRMKSYRTANRDFRLVCWLPVHNVTCRYQLYTIEQRAHAKIRQLLKQTKKPSSRSASDDADADVDELEESESEEKWELSEWFDGVTLNQIKKAVKESIREHESAIVAMESGEWTSKS